MLSTNRQAALVCGILTALALGAMTALGGPPPCGVLVGLFACLTGIFIWQSAQEPNDD